jgi:hypothetical protein
MRQTLAPFTLIALTGLGASLACTAEAQTAPALPDTTLAPAVSTYVPTAMERAAKKPQGLTYGVTLAANLNVASNRDVVGQINGNTVLFGASALGNLSYLLDRHEWLNNGSLAETFSRTPAIGQFVKSNDQLSLESLYNYFLREWTGPFARVNLQSSILKTDRVTAGATTYRQDGVTTAVGDLSTRKLRLSDSFQPFTFNESVGWFFQPLRTALLNAYGRAGLGGRHTLADGARSIKDDKATADITEYVVLKDVHQAGAELFAGLDGKQFGGRLIFQAGLSALFPILNNDDTNRSILKLTKVQLQGALGMGVTSWLSINYQLKVIRDVQLIDAIQVQNALLLSLQYTKSSPLPAAPKTQAEIDKEQIAALETRVQTAEARAAAAEARLQAAAAAAGTEAPAQLEPPAPPPVAPENPPIPAAPGP